MKANWWYWGFSPPPTLQRRSRYGGELAGGAFYGYRPDAVGDPRVYRSGRRGERVGGRGDRWLTFETGDLTATSAALTGSELPTDDSDVVVLVTGAYGGDYQGHLVTSAWDAANDQVVLTRAPRATRRPFPTSCWSSRARTGRLSQFDVDVSRGSGDPQHPDLGRGGRVQGVRVGVDAVGGGHGPRRSAATSYGSPAPPPFTRLNKQQR